MKPLQILDLPVDRVESSIVVVPFFEDQRPLQGPAALLDWRLNGLLTRQLVDGKATGHVGDRYLVKGNGKMSAEWVLFVGCGAAPAGNSDAPRRVISEMLHPVQQADFRKIGLGLPAAEVDSLPVWQQALKDALAVPGAQRFEFLLSACDPAEYIN